MLNLVTRYRHISIFLLLLLVSLTLVSLNRPADTLFQPSNVLERGMLLVLSPFQATVSRFLTEIQGVWHSYIALIKLQEVNGELQRENSLLRSQNTFYQEQILEYRRLKDTFVFLEERQFSTIPARVIGYDPGNQDNTVVVNKGSNDNVHESWPVITQDGIAGITISVSKNSSKVLLLIDPNCNVAALIQRTRDQGIVGGRSKTDAYLMKYVNRRAIIQEGVTYKITDIALQQLANEGLPGYRITDHALLRLQEAGLTTDILLLLEDLQSLLYASQTSFLRAVEARLGKEQTAWYQPLLIQHARADVLAQLHSLKERTFTSENEYLQALHDSIGPEQLGRYRNDLIRYAREEEIVVSSGLGGIFPKGLRVGTVAKVIKNDYGLFQDIEITPSVDFSKLEEVLIIPRESTDAAP
jgi:cell shape-determining protein MreC